MLSIGVTYAEVTLTGTVNQTYTNTSFGTTSSTTIGSRLGATGDSFITFAGSEDLGDGLKASFKIEPRVNMNGSDSILKVTNATTGADQGTVAGSGSIFGANREAHVDLSGAFGSVAIGNNYTPMFLLAVAPYDVNGSTNAGGYMVSNVASFNATNSIAYTLPKLVDGLSIQVALNKAGTTNTSAGNSTGYGLSYSTGGFSAGFAGETTTNGTLQFVNQSGALAGVGTGTTDVTKTAYGASYDFGAAKVALQGVNAKNTADKIDTMGYGVHIPFGSFALNLSSSTMNTTVGSAAATKYTGMQIGANYALSKRTSVYFLNADYKATAANLKQTSVGVSHSF